MLHLIPFEPVHLLDFDVQPAQRDEFRRQPCGGDFGESYTVMRGETRICAAGVLPIWPGRAYAWALLSIHAGRHLLECTRIARFTLDAAPYERIEMYVDEHFEQGRRWAEMLGFRCETPEPMRKYLTGGGGAYLYARVR